MHTGRPRVPEATWYDSDSDNSYESPRKYPTTSSASTTGPQGSQGMPRRASSRNSHSSRAPYRETRGIEETSRHHAQGSSRRPSEFSYTTYESDEPPRRENLETAYVETTYVHHSRVVRDKKSPHRRGTREHIRRTTSFERYVRGLPPACLSVGENPNTRSRSPRSGIEPDNFGAGSDEYHECHRQERFGAHRPNKEQANPRSRAPDRKASHKYSHPDGHDRNGGPSKAKSASIDPSSSRIPQSDKHNSPRTHSNQFRSEYPATSSPNHVTSYTDRIRSEHQPYRQGFPDEYDPHGRPRARGAPPGFQTSNERRPTRPAQPHRLFHPKRTPGSPPPPFLRSSPPPPLPSLTPNNTTPPDYYATLELPPHASAADIKRAARQKRVEFHPDRLKKVGMSEREKRGIDEAAMRVGMAADVLGDERNRREYDLLRARMGFLL